MSSHIPSNQNSRICSFHGEYSSQGISWGLTIIYNYLDLWMKFSLGTPQIRPDYPIPSKVVWFYSPNTAQVTQVVKNPPANAGEAGDMGLIPRSGRYPGEENGNLLQYSCPENSMNRGAWQAIVHGVAKSRTWLKWLSTQHILPKYLFHWDVKSKSCFPRKIFQVSSLRF